ESDPRRRCDLALKNDVAGFCVKEPLVDRALLTCAPRPAPRVTTLLEGARITRATPSVAHRTVAGAGYRAGDRSRREVGCFGKIVEGRDPDNWRSEYSPSQAAAGGDSEKISRPSSYVPRPRPGTPYPRHGAPERDSSPRKSRWDQPSRKQASNSNSQASRVDKVVSSNPYGVLAVEEDSMCESPSLVRDPSEAKPTAGSATLESTATRDLFSEPSREENLERTQTWVDYHAECVQLPSTPCNSPIETLYGSPSQRLSRIGSGAVDHPASNVGAVGEKSRDSEIRTTYEHLPAPPGFENRQYLVSTLDEMLAEKKTYFAHLQPSPPLVSNDIILPPGLPLRPVDAFPYGPFAGLHHAPTELRSGLGGDYINLHPFHPRYHGPQAVFDHGAMVGPASTLTGVFGSTLESSANMDAGGEADKEVRESGDSLLARDPLVVDWEDELPGLGDF
ncbi:hypothetical protein P7C70_g9447, partial [Phenoliferia sp. Uapishka_3]